MAERTIQLKLTIDQSGAITAINDVVAHGQRAANALESPFANIAARGFGIKAIVDGLAASFGGWIRASNEGEEAVASFEQAVRSAGGAVAEETARIREYAAARQEATGIDDDATVAVAAQLRAMNLHGAQLEQAIALTQDLSTLMKGDLNGAARVIADAFNGNTGMLKRYVKGLDEADVKQRGTISIIEQLTKAVGGQAEAVGNTGAGGIKKFEAAIGDLQQAFGDLLKGALAPLIGAFTSFIQSIVAAPRPIQVLALGVTALAGAFTLLGTSMGGIPFIIGGIITAAAALGVGLADISAKNKSLGDSATTASPQIETLKDRIEELRKAAGESKELEELRKKIDELRNPLTEAKLVKELEQAKAEADELTSRYQEAVSVVNKVIEAERQGVDVRSKNPELAKRYLELMSDIHKSEQENIADLEKKAGEALARQKQKEAELELFRLETAKKQKERRQSELNEQVQGDLERGKKLIELEKSTALFVVDSEEKKKLARATNEAEKLAISRQASLDRLEAEQKATLAILDLEERLLRARRESAGAEERTKIDRRLEAIGVERNVVTTTTSQKREIIELDFKLSSDALALPGSLRDLEEKIRRDTEELGNARTRDEAQTIRRRIELNQAAIDAIKKSDAELLEDQRRANEERKRMWEEQHQVAMAAINAIGAGFGQAWTEMVIVQRQGKDAGDRIWLAIENTALRAIGNVLQKHIEAAIIDKSIESAKTASVVANATTETNAVVASKATQTAATASAATTQTAIIGAQIAGAVASVAGMTAAVSAAMAAIIATASTAATLVSIATFGGAAAIGSSAVLTGLATVRAASAIGFEQGGIFERNQRGFIEGGQEEIIAPRRTFEEIMRTEIVPMIVRTTQIVTLNAPQPVFAGGYDFRRLEERLDGLRKDVRRIDNSVTVLNTVDGQQVVRENFMRAKRAVELRTK